MKINGVEATLSNTWIGLTFLVVIILVVIGIAVLVPIALIWASNHIFNTKLVLSKSVL